MGLPIIFTPIMIGFPAGLLVYWIATNVWTMGQQAVVRALLPAAAAGDAGGDQGDPSAPAASAQAEAKALSGLD